MAQNSHSGRYVISEVALITNLHPQTIRNYEKLGLVTPERTLGGSRRYTQSNVEELIYITELSRVGVNLIGIIKIIELEKKIITLEYLIRNYQPGKEIIKYNGDIKTSKIQIIDIR